jgi:hypothetical protein
LTASQGTSWIDVQQDATPKGKNNVLFLTNAFVSIGSSIAMYLSTPSAKNYFKNKPI